MVRRWVNLDSLDSSQPKFGRRHWVQSQSNEPMVTKDSTIKGPFVNILIFS